MNKLGYYSTVALCAGSIAWGSHLLIKSVSFIRSGPGMLGAHDTTHDFSDGYYGTSDELGARTLQLLGELTEKNPDDGDLAKLHDRLEDRIANPVTLEDDEIVVLGIGQKVHQLTVPYNNKLRLSYLAVALLVIATYTTAYARKSFKQTRPTPEATPETA
jgi:hypothetical protein|tara:strand:+ start:59469 stop:59948 length:480 start_codon:yes stop_codon:yes gene_type:complete